MKSYLKSRTWMVVGVVVVAASLIGVSVASAQEQNPGGAAQNDILENLYQQEQLVVPLMQLRIDLAGKIAGHAQEFIDKAKAAGKDTSALESALASFKAQIGVAQSAHDKAAGILSAHDGFDGSGKVTDADKARQTLQSVRDAMQPGHQALREGTREFRQAFREWRRANKPAGGTPAQP